jgi:hypothetical protein
MSSLAEAFAPHDNWWFDGFEVSLFRGPSPTRAEFERVLLDSGGGLPMQHRSAWVSAQRKPRDHWLLCIEDSAGQPCGAVGVQISRSRALPGHRLMRAERFGSGIPPAAYAATLEVLRSLALRDPRVLRLYVESLAFDPKALDALETSLASAGFARLPISRCYEHTLVLALDQDEDSILASMHGTARRHLRNSAKFPVRIAPVVDPRDFARLDEIAAETFSRTGGRYAPVDWARVAAASAADPEGSRLIGLYHEDADGTVSLLAFAWGCGHGDHAHYEFGATTRNADRRIPLLYPLMWDLILWAKRNGAQFFDLGGVSTGTFASDDPLGGISDFKRYFTTTRVRVGAEWAYEPRPRRARAARAIKSASTTLSRILARA